jgi:hypothetical protein
MPANWGNQIEELEEQDRAWNLELDFVIIGFGKEGEGDRWIGIENGNLERREKLNWARIWGR